LQRVIPAMTANDGVTIDMPVKNYQWRNARRSVMFERTCGWHPDGGLMIETLSGSWWAFILIGLGTGILGGTLGVGGGIIVIPALVLFFHFPQKAAQGTALALMVPMAFIGALRYWRAGDLDINPAFLILLITGAIAGVIAGTEILHRIPADMLRKIFAVFLLVIGIRMLLTSEQPGPNKRPNNVEQRSSNNDQANP